MTDSRSAPVSDIGTDIWSCIVHPESADPPNDASALIAAARLLAELASPVLADFLLAPAARRLGLDLVDPEAVEKDRLAARFALAQQHRWAGFLAVSGLDVAFIKGFANAHLYYPDPALRMQGDLDILIREADLEPLVSLLAGEGFRFRQLRINPWGMISDASFMPFVSDDGTCNIDIHVQPDCYPAWRSLDVELLFRCARPVRAGGVTAMVPSPEHVLVLCATNTAKDKFDLACLRKLIDAILVLRTEERVDWDGIVALGRDGGYLLPLRVFFCLLGALGVDTGDLPRQLTAPFGGARQRAFAAVTAEVRQLFPHEPPLTALLAREALLCAEPAVALHNLGLRIRGVIRPSSGIPKGAPVDKPAAQP